MFSQKFEAEQDTAASGSLVRVFGLPTRTLHAEAGSASSLVLGDFILSAEHVAMTATSCRAAGVVHVFPRRFVYADDAGKANKTCQRSGRHRLQCHGCFARGATAGAL